MFQFKAPTAIWSQSFGYRFNIPNNQNLNLVSLCSKFSKQKRQMTDIKSTIASNEVVVFQSDWCPYCKRTVNALQEAGILAKIIEVNDEMKLRLNSVTGKTSIPQVFVKGIFIGGYNDGGLGGTLPLLRSGKIEQMLNA